MRSIRKIGLRWQDQMGAEMKRLTTVLTSAAMIGILSAPAPARADSEDVGKIIFGIAAAALIAKAINERNDRKEVSRSQAGQLGSIERYRLNDRRILDGSIRPYNQQKTRRGYKNNPLPQACLRIIETNGRESLGYNSRCVSRNYEFASKLPSRCETILRTNRGFKSVYEARCLRREGWRVARR